MSFAGRKAERGRRRGMKGTRKEGVGNSGRYLGKNISKRTCHLYKKGWTNFLGKGAVAS